MTHSEPKPPPTRRTFANRWAELEYLCRKVSYWLYQRPRRARAARYASRLGQVLRQLPNDDRAILREEGLALLRELQGKLDEAVAHRSREIQLMERLHAEARSPQYSDATRAYMLGGRGTPALEERRAILEALRKSARQHRQTLRRAQ
jgi:hypothetical protein